MVFAWRPEGVFGLTENRNRESQRIKAIPTAAEFLQNGDDESKFFW